MTHAPPYLQSTSIFGMTNFFFVPKFPFVRKQALAAKAEAEKDGIVVPLTLEDYCIKPKNKPSNQEPPVSVDVAPCKL